MKQVLGTLSFGLYENQTGHNLLKINPPENKKLNKIVRICGIANLRLLQLVVNPDTYPF